MFAFSTILHGNCSFSCRCAIQKGGFSVQIIKLFLATRLPQVQGLMKLIDLLGTGMARLAHGWRLHNGEIKHERKLELLILIAFYALFNC
jgi:hypothetical protein